MDYETEEQQVEALKSWWRENGRSVILGVAIGAAAIFGWQGWGKYQLAQSEQASDRFTEVLDALSPDGGSPGDSEKANPIAIAESLKSDHGSSVYAVMASLAAAREQVEAGDLDGATEQLRWAASNAEQADIRVIAKLRLARVLGAVGKPDDALAALPDTVPETFSAIIEEVRGDLLYAKGDISGAHAAYQKAVNSDQSVADRNALTMKLNDLAVDS